MTNAVIMTTEDDILALQTYPEIALFMALLTSSIERSTLTSEGRVHVRVGGGMVVLHGYHIV